MRTARRREAVIAAVMGLGPGCFVDLNQNHGSAGTTTTGSTSTGTSTGATATAAMTSSTGSSGTSTGDTPGPTTGVTTDASSSSGSTAPATTTTTTDASTEPPPLCPALDAFVAPITADPVCEQCLREQCCPEFAACASGCVDVWNCANNEVCLADWGACPDYDAHKAEFEATMACRNTRCHVECNIGACSAQTTACDVDPECGAIGACSDACLVDCPDCALECWAMCKDQHPDGAPEWDAVWTCIGDQCA